MAFSDSFTVVQTNCDTITITNITDVALDYRIYRSPSTLYLDTITLPAGQTDTRQLTINDTYFVYAVADDVQSDDIIVDCPLDTLQITDCNILQYINRNDVESGLTISKWDGTEYVEVSTQIVNIGEIVIITLDINSLYLIEAGKFNGEINTTCITQYATVRQRGCNLIEITNITAGTLTYTLQQLVDDSFEDYITDITILPGETTELEIDTDGVYNLTVPDVISRNIIFIDCTARECMKNYLDSLIHCNTETNCDCSECEEKDYYNFNAFHTLYNTYLMLVDQNTNFSDPLTGIDEEELAQLTKVSDIIERFNNYCETCDQPCNNC